MKGKSSSTVDPTPLRVVLPTINGEDSASPFKFEVPDDWIVEWKPRRSSSSRPARLDKCYIEPSTGKRFRSVPEVEKYLKEKFGISTPSPLKQSPSPPKRLRRPPPKLLEQSPEKKMQIVPVSSGSSSFELPHGWVVETHQRANSSTIDKYYIELDTGKKFRSMISVKRHLSEADSDYDNESEPETVKKRRSAPAVKRNLDKAGYESAVKLRTPYKTTCSPDFVLPDDWVVEAHMRTTNIKTSHMYDKYYIEPGTGQRFRSLVSVERYLKEKEEDAMPLKDFIRPNKLRVLRRSNSKSAGVSEEETHLQDVSDSPSTKSEENPTMPKAVVADNDSGQSEHSDTPKKNDTEEDTGEETEAPKDEFGTPPSTINWVLAGPAGDMWNPYHDELMVPESTKQKWSETFISSLHDQDDK